MCLAFLDILDWCLWRRWQPQHFLGLGDLLGRCCEGCFTKVRYICSWVKQLIYCLSLFLSLRGKQCRIWKFSLMGIFTFHHHSLQGEINENVVICMASELVLVTWERSQLRLRRLKAWFCCTGSVSRWTFFSKAQSCSSWDHFPACVASICINIRYPELNQLPTEARHTKGNCRRQGF